MGGKSSKNKGANAERELAKIIEGMLSHVGDFELKRNLLQTREGGYDLDGLEGVAIEVKRCETLAIPSWWRQTLDQATNNSIPLLVYRQNRKQWTFVMRPQDAELFDCSYDVRTKPATGALAYLTETEFAQWVCDYVVEELL